MARTLNAKDKVKRSLKHCFSIQYLLDHGLEIYRGDEQILNGLKKPLYPIKLPNTRFFIGDQLVDEGDIQKIISYEVLKEHGFVILSRRVSQNERWAMGQVVTYELKKREDCSTDLGQFPTGKYGAYAEYDPSNKAIRLVGDRTGPMGVGPWLSTEKSGRGGAPGTGRKITYKGYGDNADEMIDDQIRNWLGMEADKKPIHIKEAAFMITDANEIICFPNTPDMPSILISGLKGCLAEGTLIDIPRDMKKYPEGIPIEQLVNRKGFYVYSINPETQNVEVKKAGSCEFVDEKEVFEIELVSGQKIQATGEHPFLLMDGGYKKLKDLCWTPKGNHCTIWDTEKKKSFKTDRLRMWTRSPQVNYENIIKVELKPIPCKGNPDYYRQYYKQSRIEHRFIAEQIGLKIEGMVVHHIDENHFNNTPENLEVLSHKEHFDEHGMEKYAFEKGNKVGEAGGYSTVKKPEFNQSECNRNLKKNYWVDPKYEESREKWKEKRKEIKKYRSGWRGGVIKSITPIGIRKVYDIYDVEDNHNYIANGFCVSNSGKSYTLHSLVSRFFWKPEFDYKIVVLNDSSRETGTWCLPNSDTDQNYMLKRLNERPLPLPMVYLHPKVKDDYETLYMGSVGHFITIPFSEIVENHKEYLRLEGSVRYFTKMKERLRTCTEQEEAEALLETMSLSYQVPPQTANKIRAEFDTLFETGMTDISSDRQQPWTVSKSPKQKYNPVTACVHAGVIPVLQTEYVSNMREMLSIYFTYFVKDLFMRQKQDVMFAKERSKLLLVVDEAHNIASKGKVMGSDMLLRRCVREGRPRRIGTLLATQKFGELPDVIKDNTTYLLCFKNPGEANLIANQYKMGKDKAQMITDLGKHQCLAYTTEHFIVYDSSGRRRKSYQNEVFRGKSLPPYSLHKRPNIRAS